MHRLYVQLRGETVRIVPLDMPLLSIGRTPDNGLTLPHPDVAVQHAEVRRAQGSFVITDLGGGATHLAGRRLPPCQPYRLEEGVSVLVGPFVLSLVHTTDAEAHPHLESSLMPDGDIATPRAVSAVSARAAFPSVLAPERPSTYLRYLPAIFAESEFAARLLRVLEEIWEPLQHRQDHLSLYFHPRTSPVEFLPWLAHWLGVPPPPADWPESRRRVWLANAAHLLAWRGTGYGLTRTLEVCCGVTPAIREDSARPHHLEIRLPSRAPDHDATPAVVRRLIARHVPAHVTYEVHDPLEEDC